MNTMSVNTFAVPQISDTHTFKDVTVFSINSEYVHFAVIYGGKKPYKDNGNTVYNVILFM